MLNVAGLLLMLGLAQALIQGFLLFDNGYWPNFTVRHMLAEFNLRVGYPPVRELEFVTDWLLDCEFSFTLIAIGLVLMLRGPFLHLFEAYEAARSMKEMRRQHRSSPFSDPLATHR